jgi:translation initiation factor 1A
MTETNTGTQNNQPSQQSRPTGPITFTNRDGEVVRVRMPKPHNRELIGVITDNFGNKLQVKCLDGHTRICRIPGKIRYKVRVKVGDVILIQKWSVQENEKGDYLYLYRRNQVAQLLKRGVITKEFIDV